MSTITDPIIRRRPDGSIDVDHYDGIARYLRARNQCATLKRLIVPAGGLPPRPDLHCDTDSDAPRTSLDSGRICR